MISEGPLTNEQTREAAQRLVNWGALNKHGRFMEQVTMIEVLQIASDWLAFDAAKRKAEAEKISDPTTEPDRLAEIEKRLEACRFGWDWVNGDTTEEQDIFVSQAPSDIRYLVDEVKRLRAKIENDTGKVEEYDSLNATWKECYEQLKVACNAEIQRLKAVITRWFEWQSGVNDMPPRALLDETKEIIGVKVVDRIIFSDSEVEQLRAENARLREALKPFADFSNGRLTFDQGGSSDDECLVIAPGVKRSGPITMGHCRRAADAIKEKL